MGRPFLVNNKCRTIVINFEGYDENFMRKIFKSKRLKFKSISGEFCVAGQIFTFPSQKYSYLKIFYNQRRTLKRVTVFLRNMISIPNFNYLLSGMKAC